MKRRKIFNREIILERLISAGEVSAEILLRLSLEALYIAKAMTLSPRQAQRALRSSWSPHVSVDLKSKVAFWKLLSKLKKDNLIVRDKKGKIIITAKGKKYLKTKYERPTRRKLYAKEDLLEDEIILVIFDIPEEQRIKRDWLRFQLEQFGFKILQKSVWYGEFGLPKEFIKDLRKYEILPYVHIFSVRKKGTISSIVDKY